MWTCISNHATQTQLKDVIKPILIQQPFHCSGSLAGVILAITLAAVLGAVLIVALIVFMLMKKRSKKNNQDNSKGVIYKPAASKEEDASKV
ncbi:UNVERIFIED_CONTAM: hypothetical protein FKN15_022364 [Acipenser sinensis]